MPGPGLGSGGRMMEVKGHPMQVSNMSKGLSVRAARCGGCGELQAVWFSWCAASKTEWCGSGLPLMHADPGQREQGEAMSKLLPLSSN